MKGKKKLKRVDGREEEEEEKRGEERVKKLKE